MNTYPNQDLDLLFSDIMALIEKSQNNSPYEVGFALIHIGTSLTLDMAPSYLVGMKRTLDAIQEGMNNSLAYGEHK